MAAAPSRGEIQRLGHALRTLSRSAALREAFDHRQWESWTRGGCATFAVALARWLGPEAELWMVTLGPIVDHVAVRFRGAFLDADGAATARQLVARTRPRAFYLDDKRPERGWYRAEPQLVPYNAAHPYLTGGHITCPARAVGTLQRLFRQHLGPGAA